MVLPKLSVTLDSGLTVTYRTLGDGPTVLLLHGWPTSSYLWRNVMPSLAEAHHVIAVDLPGFGGSDKPPDPRYGFELFGASIDRLLDEVGAGDASLVGHDLGGPVAVWWAMRNRPRVSRLALLNTLIYPEFSDTVVEFVTVLRTPGRREELTSDEGLAGIMRLGVVNADVLTDEVLEAVIAPFADAEARLALAKAGIGLGRRGFEEIAGALSGFNVPVRLIYGEQDKLLPDVGDTMARLAVDLPDVEVTALPDCGHFIQEEAPERVGALLAKFLGA